MKIKWEKEKTYRIALILTFYQMAKSSNYFNTSKKSHREKKKSMSDILKNETSALKQI